MAKVFLSYDRDDGQRAQAVAAALEGAGHAVWWDRQIKAGAEFAQAIEDALSGADAVIVLWSKQSVRSAWVRDEAAHGRDAGRLLPVTLDATPPPLGFRQYQAIALTEPDAMRALLAAVAGLTDGAREADAEKRPIPVRESGGQQRPTRRILWGGLAVAAALASVAGAWAVMRHRGEPPAAEARRPVEQAARDQPLAQSLTLAVLPFDDLTGAPARGALAEGLSRDLRNRLSRLRGLRVLAETSSFAAAESGAAPLELGRRLGADFLVDGSLQSVDGALRITAELVDARTGLQVWTDSQAAAGDDLANAQEQLSATVIQELISRLGPDRIQQTAALRRRRPEVVRLTLQAEGLRQPMMTARMAGRSDEFQGHRARMVALIEQALQIDPDDPVALGYMANVHRFAMTAALAARRLTPAQRGAEANRYLRRAIAADPNDAVAIELLADYERRYAWNWREAETLFRRALAIDPNNVQAHSNYAYLLSTMGRCVEGLNHGRTAAALDPEFLGRQLVTPRLLPCVGQRERASALYRTYLTREPANRFLLREVYLNTLIYSDARALRDLAQVHRVTVSRSGAVTPDMAAALDRIVAAADALEGRPEALLRMVEADVAGLADSEAAFNVSVDGGRLTADYAWTLAIEFAWAGRAERALDMLERGVAGGSLYLPQVMPGAESEFPPPVRNHPRYIALWRDDPRMAELVRLRMAAIRAGQMRGRATG